MLLNRAKVKEPHLQGLSRRGKYKIMTFGNSWTANHAKLFYQECGYKAKSILQGAAYGMVTDIWISNDVMILSV